MKKCLWVLPKELFPVQDGARVANLSLMKSVRPFFSEFDVLYFCDVSNNYNQVVEFKKMLGCNNVFSLKKKFPSSFFRKIFSFAFNFILHPSLPVSVAGFASGKNIKYISEKNLVNNYDLIVFDGLHPFSAFKNLLKKSPVKVIYRAHNVENSLWLSASIRSKFFVFSKILSWQSSKMKKIEIDLINRSMKVWNISEDDLNIFSNYSIDNENKLIHIPVGFDFIKEREIVSNCKPIKLLFLGKLDWEPNSDGLKWFLEKVWPFININQVELIIAGSGSALWGKDLFKLPGVTFIGFVQNLDEVYSQVDFSIIPIRFGSGTRIKVLESVSKAVPVISTQMGVQGSGLKDYIWAENSEEWIKTLSTLNKSNGSGIARAATSEMEKIYSPRAIGIKAFESLLQ